MNARRECIVYPTSRCIRHAQETSSHTLLPRMMTMGEFLSRASMSAGKIVPDADLRVLALHEASDFGGFTALEIERSFFSFIHNSEYIFRFFEELASEQVGIEGLSRVDVYGEYDEHLAILSHLRERYRAICERNGWADPVFANDALEVNADFLRDFDTVLIHVEGYLSRRELEILRRCAEVTETLLEYHTTAYNRKMTERLGQLGFALEEGRTYRLSFSSRSIVTEEKRVRNRSGECEVFSSRLAQIGFVKATIESYVDGGIDPSQIAVIVPDESFSQTLRQFDTEGNFNFAMGHPYAHESLYRQIESIILYLDEPNVLNAARIKTASAEALEWLRLHRSAGYTIAHLRSFMAMFEPACEAAAEILAEELERFAHLEAALAGMEFAGALRIFMNRLKACTVDDVGGGKVTVMGVLETRGMAYEGVIVVDFNEGYVPHKSEKDLFLNTTTRGRAGLPTTHDRESLQKHYYSMLFERSRCVSISCVQNAESVPSRFLLQLGIAQPPSRFRYERVLFAPMGEHPRSVTTPEGDYDFAAHPLSASSLKSFLTCRRQFYHRYVLHLTPHEIPRDLSQERDIGNALHAALEQVYALQETFESPAAIRAALTRIWSGNEKDDALERHMKRLWLEKLEPFYAAEAERFGSGWRVAYREKEGSAIVEGIVLVGRMDRIDVRDGRLEVIDYKSGQYPDVDKPPKESDTDYQLSVYAHLAATLGDVERCSYYDLSRGAVRPERYLDEKNERLREILRTMASTKRWTWEMCDDLARCRNCAYVYLCNREAMRGV